jgi:hypothetical protein
VLLGNSALLTACVEAVLWRQRRVPPVMAGGRSTPRISRTSPFSRSNVIDNSLPRSERILTRHISYFDL